MSLGFGEKLRDIISQVGYEMVGELDNDQATDLILKLIREEVVPEAKMPNYQLAGGYVEDEAWNQCRKAMLRKLGGES